MLDIVCTGLESVQTSNAQLKHVLHAIIIAHRSHDNHFSQPQPQNTHGIISVLVSSA